MERWYKITETCFLSHAEYAPVECCIILGRATVFRWPHMLTAVYLGHGVQKRATRKSFLPQKFPPLYGNQTWERKPVCESLSLWFYITFPLIGSTSEPSKNLVWTVYKQELAALFLLIRVALAYKQFSKPNTYWFTAWSVWAMNIVIIMNIGTR